MNMYLQYTIFQDATLWQNKNKKLQKLQML